MKSVAEDIKPTLCPDKTTICVIGGSSLEYLGIVAQDQQEIKYLVLQLNKEINLIREYSWLLFISAMAVFLSFLGVLKLVSTRAKSLSLWKFKCLMIM